MRSMVRDALLDDDTSREWGRKSGATLGEEGATVTPTGAIWGTFSRRNDTTGYVLAYSSTTPFPDKKRTGHSDVWTLAPSAASAERSKEAWVSL